MWRKSLVADNWTQGGNCGTRRAQAPAMVRSRIERHQFAWLYAQLEQENQDSESSTRT